MFENIRKFLTYILSSNIPELVPYLAFVLFRIPLPLTIIQILAVDLGTDMLPALALGAEKPDPGVMQPPAAGARRAAAVLGAARARLSVPRRAGSGGGDGGVLLRAGRRRLALRRAARPRPIRCICRRPRACLATIVVMQMVNVFLCRHPLKSSLSFGLFGNPLSAARPRGGTGGDPVHRLYARRQLAVRHGAGRRGGLVARAVFAAAMWVLEEARKAWLRRSLRHGVN